MDARPQKHVDRAVTQSRSAWNEYRLLLYSALIELATIIFAKLRRHDEVGLGAILGSNIFNGLLIVGVAAIIHPIDIEWQKVAVNLRCSLWQSPCQRLVVSLSEDAGVLLVSALPRLLHHCSSAVELPHL